MILFAVIILILSLTISTPLLIYIRNEVLVFIYNVKSKSYSSRYRESIFIRIISLLPDRIVTIK